MTIKLEFNQHLYCNFNYENFQVRILDLRKGENKHRTQHMTSFKQDANAAQY